jgi:ankyrin repeat protein
MNEVENLIEAVNRGDVDGVRALLRSNTDLVHKRDDRGATALHFAAQGGHSAIVRLLLDHGAEINALDGQFGATPTGWAIEYLRELGGFLGIELDDFAYAIQRGDVEWVTRLLLRFPVLREARDTQGKPFKVLAQESGNLEIVRLFGSETTA